jgi:hypothetical protein
MSLLVTQPTLLSQVNNASLGGLITDTTGSALRKVEVSLQSTDTGAKRTVHTDDAGRYLFEQLTASGTPPFYSLGSVSNPVFPNAYSLIGNQPVTLGSLSAAQYQRNYPYVMQENATIQRDFGKGGVLTVSYAGSHGVHIPRDVDFNQSPQTVLPDGQIYFPVGSTVKNPNIGSLRYTKTDGFGTYNSLILSFQHHLTSGLLFRANYTWSKNLDCDSLMITPGGANDLPQNPLSCKAERGLSNYDVRNNFVTYLVYDIPGLAKAKKLTTGWQANWITTIESGQPFAVTQSGLDHGPLIGTGSAAGAQCQRGNRRRNGGNGRYAGHEPRQYGCRKAAEAGFRPQGP